MNYENEWKTSPDKVIILRAMREAGKSFEEISEVVGLSAGACKIKCFMEGIYLNGKTPITGDTKEPKYHGRPVQKSRAGVRKCNHCGKPFNSWDVTKNHRCTKCKALDEYSVMFNR